MDNDLMVLYKASMGLLMKKEAKTHKCFFTQEEFEKNMGKIFIITGASRNLNKKLKKIC